MIPKRSLLPFVGAAVVLGAVAVVILAALYYSGDLCGAPARQKQLFIAIWRGDTNGVARLLTAGVDPDGPSGQVSRPTPLIDAVRFADVEIIRLLLEQRADPNKGDRNGVAALYHALKSPAVANGGEKVATPIFEMLIAHGANPSGKWVTNVAMSLPADDPRLRGYQKALAAGHKGR